MDSQDGETSDQFVPSDGSKNRRRFLKGLGIAGAAGIAGCTGDDGVTDTPTADPTTSATGTGTGTGTGTPVDTETSTGTKASCTDTSVPTKTQTDTQTDTPTETATVEPGEVDHPYLLWTSDDLDRIRAGIENDDWQATAWERMKSRVDRGHKRLVSLLKVGLFDDDDAAAAEKDRLMQVVNSPEPRGSSQWLTVLRYDLLYDRLSEDERAAFREMARTYIQNILHERAIFDSDVFNDERSFSRYDAQNRNQVNWLPNIVWPWTVSANLLAAATGDEDLIRETWNAQYSMKWYIDEYLNDSGFYGEEFGKMGSTPGAMLVYGKAVENLGLTDIGFGYTGTGGASLRGHIGSLLKVTYPRIKLYSDRPMYPLMTMGDKRQGGNNIENGWNTPAFQYATVDGYLPNGQGGPSYSVHYGAWGGERRGNNAQWDKRPEVPKMLYPFWFELGAAKWPEDGYPYFLYHMRPPDADRYVPSLVFGAEPIGPQEPDPPAAPSGVYPERGIAMLRAEASPQYWESPAPAVGLRSASPYAHATNDSFALLGMYAENRPLLLNRQLRGTYAQGFSRGIQGHNGIRIDGAQPNTPPPDTTTYRTAFSTPAKLYQMRSVEVYPGTHLNRSLVVTREYVIDLVRAMNDGPRQTEVFVHALGDATTPATRQDATGDLVDANPWLQEPTSVSPTSDGWLPVTFPQTRTVPESEASTQLPDEWFEAGIGVKLMASGSGDGNFLLGTTPYIETESDGSWVPTPKPVGGRSLVASREGEETGFVHGYRPFSGGEPSGDVTIRSLPDGNDAIQGAVVDRGNGSRDVIALGPAFDTEYTLSVSDTEFSFTNLAWVRLPHEECPQVLTADS